MPTEDQKRDEEKRDAFKLIVADQQLLALQVEAEPKIIAPMLDWSSKQRAVIEAAMAAAYRAGREDAARPLKIALDLIGTECTNYIGGNCEEAGREPDAKYGADRWCNQCIAKAALDEYKRGGFLPTEEQPTEGQDRNEEQR